MGLAISDGIAQKFGGDITFESKPGEGSIFRFKFQIKTSMDAQAIPKKDGTSIISKNDDLV